MVFYVLWLAFMMTALVYAGVYFWRRSVDAKALPAIAETLGAQYLGENPPDTLKLMRRFESTYSDQITLQRVMRIDVDDLRILLAELHGKSVGGDPKVSQVISLIKVSSSTLPDFVMWPESALSTSIATFFGKGAIRFEDTPHFSSRFAVRGDDEHAIRAVFTPQVRHHYVEFEPRPTIESRAGWLLFLSNSHRHHSISAKPAAMTGYVDRAITACEPLL